VNAVLPTNGLSVDVEDWFQVGAFEGVIERASWDSLALRVERNCETILEMFAAASWPAMAGTTPACSRWTGPAFAST
jgi:hypothetical protein